MRVSVLAGCALLVAACPANSTTIHVAPDGSGDYPTIQAAIDAASSGDEVVLSDGTFTGDGNWDIDFGTKELVLRSENGYEATFLDGGFDCLWADALHWAVLLQGSQTAATRIEGLTFQHFLAGAGVIRCVGTSPVIRMCRFRLNHASWQDPDSHGREVVAEGAGPTIQDCFFEGDICSPNWRDGVAVYARGSWTTIERCSFSNVDGTSCVDLDGGAITDCVFASISGGIDGQGICLRAATGEVSVQRCRFHHNFGIGVRVESQAHVLIGSCIFEDIMGDSGGGASANGATTIRNTAFRRIHSGFGGGVVDCGAAAVALDHCVFLDNTNSWPGRASAVSTYGTDLEVTRCTFVRNRNLSSGERGSALTLSQGADLSMDHTIIALGGQAGLPDGAVHCEGSPGSVSVVCSDFFGNDGGDWTGCVAGMDGANGNLSADPLFCDVAAGDLSLQGDSPCAPANTGDCGMIGALGPWCGPLAVQQQSWGSIKALYR